MHQGCFCDATKHVEGFGQEGSEFNIGRMWYKWREKVDGH